MFASSRAAAWHQIEHDSCGNLEARQAVWFGQPSLAEQVAKSKQYFVPATPGGLVGSAPPFGWSNVLIPGEFSYYVDKFGSLLVWVFQWPSITIFNSIYCLQTNRF